METPAEDFYSSAQTVAVMVRSCPSRRLPPDLADLMSHDRKIFIIFFRFSSQHSIVVPQVETNRRMLDERALTEAYNRQVRGVRDAHRALAREEREIQARLTDLELEVSDVIRDSFARADDASNASVLSPPRSASLEAGSPAAMSSAQRSIRSPVGSWSKRAPSPSYDERASPPPQLHLQSPSSPPRTTPVAHQHRTPLEDLALLGPEGDTISLVAERALSSLLPPHPPSPPAGSPPRTLDEIRWDAVAALSSPVPLRGPSPQPASPQRASPRASPAAEAPVVASPWDELLSNSELTRTQFALFLPVEAFSALTAAEREAIRAHLASIEAQPAPRSPKYAAERRRATAKLDALSRAGEEARGTPYLECG